MNLLYYIKIKNKKYELDEIIRELSVTKVGNGYAECICPKENTEAFISRINKLKIRILSLSWWCYVSDGHTPCGMGGPLNEYGEGWYSEIIGPNDSIEFKNNADVINYLLNIYPKSDLYRSCFVPAFYLAVPSEWKSKK